MSGSSCTAVEMLKTNGSEQWAVPVNVRATWKSHESLQYKRHLKTGRLEGERKTGRRGREIDREERERD